MTVKEYLENTFTGYEYTVRDKIVCVDGFSVSVQGGTRGHYCMPRKLCNIYTKVELGFPSSVERSILEYAENEDCPTETVYAFVPIEVVEKLIASHGGIK